MSKRKKNTITTYDPKRTTKTQHKRPCRDCPFARTAIKGWIGGSTPEEYCAAAHSDGEIGCHVIANQQCAGAAIYRANVIKHVTPPLLILPADKKAVFSTPGEFLEHHGKTTQDFIAFMQRRISLL